jgi:hypothetical protein
VVEGEIKEPFPLEMNGLYFYSRTKRQEHLLVTIQPFKVITATEGRHQKETDNPWTIGITLFYSPSFCCFAFEK